ncbi:MAG: DNA-binding CsgD family transcriptional regulator [Alpinimonas sp.]|jgi:DNA-binding CsgD family transcriptional regulator
MLNPPVSPSLVGPSADAPSFDARSFDVLDGLALVAGSALLEIAANLSTVIAPLIAHSALVIFTEDCSGRPQKKAGDPAITERVSIAELDIIRADVAERGGVVPSMTATIAGTPYSLAAWIASTGSLLVLVEPVRIAATSEPDTFTAKVWELGALSIRQQVKAALPDYLRDSRIASTERTRIITELTDAHATTLELLLAMLRSRETSDMEARRSATDFAASSMVRLRAVSDRDRSLSEEPVAQAFERLREDLRPLARFGDLDVQFVEPPVNGRALPGEVAHAGRAIVRGAVLALVEQPGVGRVRVQWDCDGSNLLINIRDDGPGTLTLDTPSVRQLSTRISALDGQLSIAATEGWGSDIVVVLPLDAPAVSAHTPGEWGLTAREFEVFTLVVQGSRNRAIANSLVISENTVKFHVANILKKVGATNRSELAALVRT